MQTRWETAAVLGLALLLTACGGGGGGGGGSSDSGTNGSGSGSGSPSSNPSGAPSTGGGNSTTNPINTPQPIPSGATGNYRVQLHWTAPGTRADGTPLPLSELSGYRVYYLLEGSDPSSDSTLSIVGGSTTVATVTLFVAGNYTFAITAVDQNGLESSLSTPVSVPIN